MGAPHMGLAGFVVCGYCRCGLGDLFATEVRNAFDTQYMPKLVIITLRNNRLTASGTSTLINSFKTSACEALFLERNSIEPEEHNRLRKQWVATGKPENDSDVLLGLFL